MLANQKLKAVDGYEVMLFPLEYMNVSQDEGDSYSHAGTYQMDFLGWDSNGRVYTCSYYAPCTCQCVATTDSSTHNRVYQSVNQVHLADGSLGYVTFEVAHDNNPPHNVGDTISQGELLGRTGTSTNVGDHMHFQCGRGTYQGWTQLPNGNWMLSNEMHIYDACYLNNTVIINKGRNTYNTWNLEWISKDAYLNQSEMENNATIIINYYRSIGLDDCTIAGILGNMQAESTLSPILNERGGGGGYGLVQWTPKSDLINACSTLGLSPYTSGDIQIQVIIQEITGPQSVRQWYTTSAFISNYYNSGATSDMIGITGDEFLHNTMGWTPEKLAIMFMAGYERPSYLPLINHYLERQRYARNWFNFMSGLTPPTPIYSKKKRGYNFVLFDRRRRFN